MAGEGDILFAFPGGAGTTNMISNMNKKGKRVFRGQNQIQEHRTMTKFLLPIAINVINKAVDKIPEDLDELLKKFLVSVLKKAAAKSGNKVDDLLVAQLEKALFEK